ncbi:MAG TPA: hypothetical protein VFE34_23535 [Dongiaceae bacterium]|jgi:hypothetical protein|nr:hypothetical protein [Dongiaceae bacterium]
MALPEPAPGLVISYSYLWHDEHRAGVEEGRKDRPCAIVVARLDEAGDTSVLVVPITHTQPAADRHAVKLPLAVKRHLGLDEAPSWIITDELNQFIWPGFDLRPTSRQRPDRFHFGFLPTEIFDAVKRAIRINAMTVRRVNR